ncbi:MAG: SH3 domain-containing protein [Clostridia bacterium]|nr:SH3 domain-containing protein [Clostridia bacterium]
MMTRKVRMRTAICLLMLCSLLFTGTLRSLATEDEVMPISQDEITEIEENPGTLVLPETYYGNATVNVTALNLRAGPGTQYDIIGTLSQSQPILMIGKYEGWYVIYDYDSGKIGCVNGYYITPVSEDSMDDPKLPGEDSPSTGNGTGQNTPQTPDSNTEGMSEDAKRLMSLVNDMRTRHDVSAISYSHALSKVAQDKAEDMVANMYFDHQSDLYGTPFEMMRAYGITFTCAAENIAGNQTVDGAFYAWMNSDSHKANIMNGNYSQMGIGVCVSPIYGKIIVQMFAGN